MGNITPTKAVVNTNQSSNGNQVPISVILYNEDGTAAGTVTKAAAQANTTAADLAALKVDFNALLAKLRTAGVIAT